MSDPRARLRTLLTPPPGTEVRQTIGRFLTQERDPLVRIEGARRAEEEADGRDSIRPAPVSLATRMMDRLPESVQQGARSFSSNFDRGPIGAAIRYVQRTDPTEIAADVASAPIISLGRQIVRPGAAMAREILEEVVDRQNRQNADIVEKIARRYKFDDAPPVYYEEGPLTVYSKSDTNNTNYPQGLPMDLASQTQRADEFFPYATYHNTRVENPGNDARRGGLEFLEARRGRNEYKDIPATHTGSFQAAFERSLRTQNPKILDLRFRAQSPFLEDSGKIFDEVTLENMVKDVPVTHREVEDWITAKFNSLDMKGFGINPAQDVKQNKFRQALLDEGYDIIPYINKGEDVGSVSFMHLHPEKDLRFRGAAFNPDFKDWSDLMAGVSLPALFTGGAVANQRRKRED